MYDKLLWEQNTTTLVLFLFNIHCFKGKQFENEVTSHGNSSTFLMSCLRPAVTLTYIIFYIFFCLFLFRHCLMSFYLVKMFWTSNHISDFQDPMYVLMKQYLKYWRQMYNQCEQDWKYFEIRFYTYSLTHTGYYALQCLYVSNYCHLLSKLINNFKELFPFDCYCLYLLLIFQILNLQIMYLKWHWIIKLLINCK